MRFSVIAWVLKQCLNSSEIQTIVCETLPHLLNLLRVFSSHFPQMLGAATHLWKVICRLWNCRFVCISTKPKLMLKFVANSALPLPNKDYCKHVETIHRFELLNVRSKSAKVGHVCVPFRLVFFHTSEDPGVRKMRNFLPQEQFL